jgi:Domain of unknown function (DUF6457)
MSDEWIDRAAAALGIEDDVPIDAILDLARDVAHGVERKAAPVSTFLAGLAAGRAGGDAASVQHALETLRGLV